MGCSLLGLVAKKLLLSVDKTAVTAYSLYLREDLEGRFMVLALHATSSELFPLHATRIPVPFFFSSFS